MKQLGAGGFGVVWLEKETTTQQLRAVKKLAVEQLAALKVDFRQELQTLIALKGVGIPGSATLCKLELTEKIGK